MLSRKLVILGILVTACCGAAFIGCGNNSTVTQPPVVNEQPIPTPDGISATGDNTGSVTLHWNASSSSQVVGYNVYSYSPSPNSENAYRKINPSVVATNQFTSDDLAFGGDFRVKAVNSFGHEGSPSAAYHLYPNIPNDTVRQH